MPATFDLALDGRIMLPPWGRGAASIGVLNGKNAEIGSISARQAPKSIDCRQLYALHGMLAAAASEPSRFVETQ